MLPMLAMAVAGLMAKGGEASGQKDGDSDAGLGGLLGGLLGDSGRGDVVSGLASMLDADGDGNPLDDILKTLGR
jgi:hypothetical protein